jgi:dephospho-CoA kinase
MVNSASLILGNEVPVIGVTGGISTGKTSFCDCLREIVPEATFFNADTSARDLTDNDAEVERALREQFGDAIFSDTGDLNRAALRAIVFADAEKKSAVEQILHPRIRERWSKLAETARKSGDLFLADIPLLYETGGETLCDRVVVVACSRATQVKRLLARTALDRAEAEQIINSQMPLEEKIRRADQVIWNNGDRSNLKEQARLVAATWRK